MRWMKWAIAVLAVAVVLLGVAVYLLLEANPNGLLSNGDAIAARFTPAPPRRDDEGVLPCGHDWAYPDLPDRNLRACRYGHVYRYIDPPGRWSYVANWKTTPRDSPLFQPLQNKAPHDPIIWSCGHRLKKMIRNSDPALAWCEKGEEFECKSGDVHWHPVPSSRYTPPPP